MKTTKSTVKDITERQALLKQIIDDYKKKGRQPSRKDLLVELEKRGHHIDMSTLYRDKTAINSENYFVVDIAETNYSAYMEEIWESYELIKQEAIKNYEKDWVITKEIERSKNEPETITEKIYGHPDSKLRFLKLLKEATDSQVSLLKGDTLDVSVGFLGKKLGQYKEELTIQEQELESKDKEIVNLTSKIYKLNAPKI